jgi:hypothetical protein
MLVKVLVLNVGVANVVADDNIAIAAFPASSAPGAVASAIAVAAVFVVADADNFVVVISVVTLAGKSVGFVC